MSGLTNESKPQNNEDNNPPESAEKLDFVDDINVFSQTALKSVLEATRNSNSLPTGDDYDFYSTFRSVRDVLDIESQKILSLIDNILSEQCVKGRLARGAKTLEIEDKFDVLTEANDHILERIGTNLDEASGIKKNETKLVVTSVTTDKQIATSWNKRKSQQDSRTSFRLLTAKHTPRPQFKFKDKIDNSESPFIPKIKYKPNALISLEESLTVTQDSNDQENIVLPHPYQYELEKFQPTEKQLETQNNIEKPKPISETQFTYVDTIDELNTLLSKLKTVDEIALDLEAHSYRSYQGITCLMQISTRGEDFIVDTIALRSELYILNEVFTDSTIVKVLHGANMDILWLQRDFGLYVVNMFDTGQAARVLSLPRLSLAHLLHDYCGEQTNKQYQLADWRIRPLPQELITYARTDTHHLLEIYDKMRNELLENGNDQKNLLRSVYDRSRDICLAKYYKHVVRDETHLAIYRKSKNVFDSQQLSALKQLYAWRDKIARLEDESSGYVLPNHMLLQIASILPRERQGILACCNPIPPIVRQYLNELHAIVAESRNIPVVKKEKPTVPMSSSEILKTKIPTFGDNTSMYCPHDLSKHGTSYLPEFDSDLVASTGSMFQASSSFLVTTKPIITAFSPVEKTKFSSQAMRKAAEIRASFEPPFDMFLPNMETKCKKTWLLKPSTIVTPKDNSTSPKYVPPSKRKRSPENKLSFRQQVAKQRKPRLEEEEKDKEEIVLPKDKKIKKEKSDITQDFKPFDYSTADKSMFHAPKPSKGKGKNFKKHTKFKK